MAYWLLKTEPATYSWDDLARAGRATWDGVANPVALRNLRSMSAGDLCAIYHTGGEKRVVGIAEVVRTAYPDPKQKDEKMVVVDLAARDPLAAPVTLEALKKEPSFSDSPLLKIGRLSVVPINEGQWTVLMKRGRG